MTTLPVNAPPQPPSGRLPSQLVYRLDWLLCFLSSAVVVFCGVVFGRGYVAPAPGHDTAGEPFLNALFHWDGNYYREIAAAGYRYDPQRQSTIHFFPLYPLVGRSVAAVTGFSIDVSLILTSAVSFAGALYLLGRYVIHRYGSDQNALRLSVLLAAAFTPAGIFFRVGYSESLFLLLCVLTLYLIERGAKPWLVGVVIGLATATRPVGIALLPPYLIYVLSRSPNRWRAIRSVPFLLPLSCFGLFAFMFYCNHAFGDPLAFAHNMRHWFLRQPPPVGEKILILAGFEPVWTVFLPRQPAFFGRYTTIERAVFSLYAVNPVYFVGAVFLTVVGMRRRWLNVYEWLTAWGLILIPYWSAGYEVQMTGMARYVTVAVPLYLVLGRLLVQMPVQLGIGCLAFSAFFMGIYAALFAQWYWFV